VVAALGYQFKIFFAGDSAMFRAFSMKLLTRIACSRLHPAFGVRLTHAA
jgi:hypothetical protein